MPIRARLHFHVGTPLLIKQPIEREGEGAKINQAYSKSFVEVTMKAHELVLIALGTPGVSAFFVRPAHALRTNPGSCGYTRMAALDFSASPVNSAETLKRTTDLSLAGAGSKKKLALLGSTVRTRTC